MASISEKRTSPSQPSHVIKDNGTSVSGAQILIQNAFSHGHGHGHGHQAYQHPHPHQHQHPHQHPHPHQNPHPHPHQHQHQHQHQHHHHHNQNHQNHHQQQQGHNHHHHQHHHHYHQHAKENASSGRGSAATVGGSSHKKSLEILDFHESWLEEVQMYRDIMHVRKHYPQQLLASHNHVHTPQGCQLENGHNAKMSRIAELNAANKAIVLGASSSAHQNLEVKRKVTPPTDRKQRVRVGCTLAGIEASKDVPHHVSNNQLHLKRPRDHSPTNAAHKASGHAKRSSKSPVTRQNSPTKVATSHVHSGTNASANAAHSHANHNTSIATTAPTKPNMKIIVNQFHASSLLNGHEFEEKAKILTQNGLTKSSATTAYEASFYAANYLTPGRPKDSVHGMMMTRAYLGDYSNYVGVSLAKNGNDGQHHHGQADDDPCGAIDDVTTYTDTDSEEEYTGEPFYLELDAHQTVQQSKNIRCRLSEESMLTNDTEKSQQSDYYRPKEILTPSLFPNVPPYLNFSSHAEKGPIMPAQLHKVLKWKLSPVMPKIVKRVVLNSGFRIIKNTTDWMAIWEKHMKSPGFRTIRSHQKYNHMPGSFRIGRKDTMWRSIQQNMKKYGTKEFGFMQKSYVMPDDLESLRQAWPKNASRLTKWIVKPPASARGTGIRIVNKWSQFPKDRPLVVQKYIERPLLINDNKFDMRIYVVLTSVNPLRIYLYKDGLARFASVKYSSELNSLDERCMHLTNYSINKFSQNYSKNEDFNACQGHKWTLQSLWSCLEARGVNTKRLWATLRNLVIKAIVSGEAGLNRMYRQNVNFRYNCFELFGFDVLLDENLIPWLLEINISPSLHSELPLDLHVKGPLIQAVLNTALYQVPPKLTEKTQREILHELKLEGPLCHDKRIFTTCLTTEEVRKHNQFTNRSVEFREEYLDNILENLLPDDVRCLVVSEDELARCSPLERIFPTPSTYNYLKFIENPRYYNRLLDAWEHRFGHCREKGIELLTKLCKDKFHLNVSDAALEKEPNVDVTEIDMLHIKKSDDDTTNVNYNTSNITAGNHLSDSDIPSQLSNDDLQQDRPAERIRERSEGQGDEPLSKDERSHNDNNLVNATQS